MYPDKPGTRRAANWTVELQLDRNIVTYLTEPEIDALLQAPDQNTWLGSRDRTMLTVAFQTGLRASELTDLRITAVPQASAVPRLPPETPTKR